MSNLLFELARGNETKFILISGNANGEVSTRDHSLTSEEEVRFLRSFTTSKQWEKCSNPLVEKEKCVYIAA